MKFENLPIQKKLTRLILYISITILVVTGVIFFAYDYYSYKQSTVEKLKTVGEIIATNSTAALAFNSQEDAFDVIQAVEAEPEIISVCLYDEQGQLFSYFPENIETKMKLDRPALFNFEFKPGYLEMYLPVEEGERQLGSLYLRYSLEGFFSRLKLYGLISSTAILISFLIIWLLSKRLQKIITQPILSLAGTAETISRNKDYALRANKFSDDEVGKLTDAFNKMVRQIEQQNETLQGYNKDLEEKAAQLELASKYKSEFLANMSHELRSPLNSLLILSNDLSKNKRNNLNEEELESVKIIYDSGKDLLNLINDILDLSKIEAGKMEVHEEKVSIGEVVSSNQKLFKPLTAQKGLEFNTMVEQGVPEFIKTDEQKLNQILKNLFSNAVKFTSNGGVSLRVENDSNWIYFRVKDTGIGIPEEKRELIFEAFKQAEGGTARRYGGTGLGLSIATQLAELLGGHLSLKSEMGSGSEFTLALPNSGVRGERTFRVQEATVIPEIPDMPHKQDQENFINYPSIPDDRDSVSIDEFSVLLIEDDNSFANILAKEARKKGFKVLAAATAEDGLVLTEKYSPSAIILDIKLPGMSGLTFLGILKSNPKLRHIPVHVISAVDKTETPLKSGVLNYLTKPVKREQLQFTFDLLKQFLEKEMKKLLLVEDEDKVRKAIVKMVRLEDVQILEADSVDSAIKLLQKETVDCMILDLGLGDGDAEQIVSYLKNNFSSPLPPIIVYTGKDLSDSQIREIKKWAEIIIPKDEEAAENLINQTTLLLHKRVEELPEDKVQAIQQQDGDLSFRGKKVLLVDDDMRNIFALSRFLRSHEIEVIKAESGPVAIEQLQKYPNVDVILMDIMMPGMDGYEAIGRIRADERFRDKPIIALTAKAMPEDRQKCIDAGASDYFAKPVDTDKLLNLLRLWMQ